ncbi:hypothetical protein [uncultured Tenacibaculum sp.]|uniref:hypothetical protein n=1 Tax=uncultured Tenacibaculum sp. TaxID=174713 RepID=UPI00261903C0|nr:hypothetical protein [uncultured Tenacibaculum sp.]
MKEQNINLDFLYYQRKLILDGVDPKEEEYKSVARIFENEMKKCELSKAVQLIILGYKEKYAQHKFYGGCFYEVKTPMVDTEYPDYLGPNDFYMPKQEMSRRDIEHLILRIFKDDYEKTNTRYLQELELMFTEPQDLNDVIEKTLKDKEFSKKESYKSTFFIVEDSPISEIEVSSKKFIMRTNSDKWKAYY